MAISVPLRHELKFFINPVEYEVLRRALDRVLWRDPNGDENNEYFIRSLYFDTWFNDALIDKLDGVKNRDKYRMRTYNFSDKMIRMECKTKVGSLISKRSIAIPRLLADQLIAGDPTGLEPFAGRFSGNDDEWAASRCDCGLCAGGLYPPGGGSAHYL